MRRLVGAGRIERGELTMRTEGNLLWERSRGEEQLDELLELRSAGSLGRLRIRGAKIFQDGVAENFTAAMLAPWPRWAMITRPSAAALSSARNSCRMYS